MQRLTYQYKCFSTLAYRTFIVNVQLSAFGKDTDATFEVIAPDQIFAQEIVRRHLDPLDNVITFWTYAVREVVTKPDGSVFIRPFMLDGKSIRFPYLTTIPR